MIFVYLLIAGVLTIVVGVYYFVLQLKRRQRTISFLYNEEACFVSNMLVGIAVGDAVGKQQTIYTVSRRT
jgi:hypothetical protein